jgi:hypothetical protein
MSVQTPERPASVVAFAATKGRPDTTMVADDAGHGIIALLQKAADMAKEDCTRAMNLAHKLSSQLRASEERAREIEERAREVEQRAREFEAQAIDFRDRAARAEDWLAHIHSHVEKTFFRPPGDKEVKPLFTTGQRGASSAMR